MGSRCRRSTNSAFTLSRSPPPPPGHPHAQALPPRHSHAHVHAHHHSHARHHSHVQGIPEYRPVVKHSGSIFLPHLDDVGTPSPAPSSSPAPTDSAESSPQTPRSPSRARRGVVRALHHEMELAISDPDTVCKEQGDRVIRILDTNSGDWRSILFLS